MKKVNLIRAIATNEDIELVYFWEAEEHSLKNPPNKQEVFLLIADIMRKNDILEIKAVNFNPLKEEI